MRMGIIVLEPGTFTSCTQAGYFYQLHITNLQTGQFLLRSLQMAAVDQSINKSPFSVYISEEILTHWLHEIMSDMSKSHAILPDWKKGLIVPIWKRKGSDRTAINTVELYCPVYLAKSLPVCCWCRLDGRFHLFRTKQRLSTKTEKILSEKIGDENKDIKNFTRGVICKLKFPARHCRRLDIFKETAEVAPQILIE